MGREPRIVASAAGDQVAGVVPRGVPLPGNVHGFQRTVRISPERIAHMRRRRPIWLAFCLDNIPLTLASPDLIGHRTHGDPRRVEFVKLVGRPGRWLLVSVKFLDDRREAWVNSAVPVSSQYLTRRQRARTMHRVARGP